MTIEGTMSLSGRAKYTPLVPSTDSSGNPAWFADVLEQMSCSQKKEDDYTLTADGDTVVNLGSLPNGFNAVMIKVKPNVGQPPSPGFPNGIPAVPSPVTAKLTSAVGTAQAASVDPFLYLVSQTVPYTALSLARPNGVQVTVRVTMFAIGS